ncbi:MAG: dTDP-4-dehydrorhamnose 3,5-epimerase [Parcubacteria group bacterium]|jgi:dTDP-4-dehydrorhamnose 3,5-epimerase|nr:dTDP-4-dehydrorhamnose 3,5-epimerase [Parcubacteria group bacterium]|tara:strand:+ start:11530 stop:12036 length:507 start_codon:yes stop_codon:yes gene_type:complete
MIVEDSKLSKVKVVTHTDTFEDFRGEYVETYNKKLYFDKGISVDFVQDDYSWSTKNVLRGLHGDDKIWKLVCCPFGKYYLVVLDLDKGSSTYKQWESFVLSDNNKKQVLIPPNHANGHLILSKKAIFQYKQSEYYSPGEQFTIKYNDPEYNIWWPINNPILSKRDQCN